VIREARGHGLGKRLVEAMIDRGPGVDFRWMLHTSDAHGLYRQFGFGRPDESYLERLGAWHPARRSCARWPAGRDPAERIIATALVTTHQASAPKDGGRWRSRNLSAAV
jgi:hypothetical protein